MSACSTHKQQPRRSRLFSQEANPVEHFLKTGLGAQRVEFFVNREPENQIRIPHSVSFFQCFKRFLPHSQVHVTPGYRGETVLFLQQDFQLALPVSSHSPRGQGASEFRSSLATSSNRLLVLTFLLPTDRKSTRLNSSHLGIS